MMKPFSTGQAGFNYGRKMGAEQFSFLVKARNRYETPVAITTISTDQNGTYEARTAAMNNVIRSNGNA